MMTRRGACRADCFIFVAITCRMWYWLFHTFTAAVCQAVLVIVAPSHPLSPAAFESMQAAVELFERADGDRAKSAAVRVGWLAAKASQTMEAYRKAQMQQQPASSAGSRSPPLKLEFPTSNIRGNPEDLLGTKTKLIRAQPGETLPPAASLAGVLPPMHPGPLTNNGAAYQFDRRHDARYVRPAGHTHWGTALSPPVTGDNMDWGPDFQYHNIPVEGNNGHVEHELQPHFPQAPSLDPSMYLSVDGFDLSGFIQNGANAWMFDRAPELESEVSVPIYFLLYF